MTAQKSNKMNTSTHNSNGNKKIIIQKNKDKNIMKLDTSVGSEYDKADTMPLDSRIKYENDNSAFSPSSSNIDAHTLFPSNIDAHTLSPSDCDTTSLSSLDSVSFSLSSSCLTRRSRAKTCFMPQAFRCAECGRSMVEMLGVLAVIGVLSIGGIAGYSYGMDRYRANETINDIMLKSIDIVTNINQNKAPNVSFWSATNPIGYPISFVQDIPNDRYGIQIQNVPSRVCKIVGDALKNMAIVYVGSEDYTPDTNTDPCDESDNNTMEFYFESLKCEPACQDDEICLWGECVSENIEKTKWNVSEGACETNDDCGPCGWCNLYEEDGFSKNKCYAFSNYHACTVDGMEYKGGMCLWGECIPKTGCGPTNPCTGKREYCSNTENTCHDPFPSGNTGTCLKVDFKPYTFSGREYWVSNTVLNYWDAVAACQALGFNDFISVHDLVEGWDEKTITVLERTSLGDYLNDILGGYYVWTKEIVQSSYSSCPDSYLVKLDAKKVYPYGFHSDYTYYAVCQ